MGIRKTQFKLSWLVPVSLIIFHSNFVSAKELIEVNRIVAKVNDRIVTWGEIAKAMDRLNFSNSEKKLRASEFVDGKIDRLLSIVAFSEKGMVIPDSYIEQEYNKRLIQEFNGDRKLFRDVLKSNGQSQLEYRDEIREEIIYGHMLATRKRLKEEISPDKVEAYYKNNPSLFVTEEKVRIREIAFSQIADEPASVLMQQARKTRANLAAGEPFEKLAAQNGQSPYRDKAGDWGVLVSKREIRSEELRKEAFSLATGKVSQPFLVSVLERKSDGSIGKSGKSAVYIIKVDEKIPSGRKPLDSVRNEIEKILTANIEKDSQQRWLAKLKKDAYVEINLPN